MIQDQMHCNKKNEDLIELNKQITIFLYFFLQWLAYFSKRRERKQEGKKKHVVGAQLSVF